MAPLLIPNGVKIVSASYGVSEDPERQLDLTEPISSAYENGKEKGEEIALFSSFSVFRLFQENWQFSELTEKVRRR